MWAYNSGHHRPQPWPQLLSDLTNTPLPLRAPDLQDELVTMLTDELARDPELEDVHAASQLIDMAEQHLESALPWYGGVLRFTNTALTGWTPQERFLVQDRDRVPASVSALLDATATLPTYIRTLERAFVPIRVSVLGGGMPISEVESVLDAVITTTASRSGWDHALYAALQWMHEACGVPLPEARRQAMADWLAQSCLPGIPPSSVARAEILAAMARSLRRTARY